MWFWETRLVGHFEPAVPVIRREWRLKKRRKPLQIGDKMPKDAQGPFGAMIKVCPCCDRIDAIFIP